MYCFVGEYLRETRHGHGLHGYPPPSSFSANSRAVVGGDRLMDRHELERYIILVPCPHGLDARTAGSEPCASAAAAGDRGVLKCS